MDPESFPPPVVVGVDASLAAQQAARFAAAEARLRRAPLHIVTVMSWPYRGPAAPSPPGIDVATALGDGGTSLVRATSDALHDEGGDLAVTTEVLAGDPVLHLREAAAHAQLLVLGSRGVGGVAGLVVGSTAAGVVAAAACPVVVLPDETATVVRGRRSVVVEVEGRQGDEEVLGFAFAEASARGTDVLAVHAWQDVVLDTGIRTVSPLVDWAGVLADEERLLAEALAGWREKEPDVVVREAVVRERAARALVAASMTAELLVVGHRKRRPSLGSTTHGVLHRAACPVAIVPITGAGR